MHIRGLLCYRPVLVSLSANVEKIMNICVMNDRRNKDVNVISVTQRNTVGLFLL